MNSLHEAIGEYVDTLPEESRQKLAEVQQPTVSNTDLINELMDRLNDVDRRMAAMYLVGYLAADRDPDFVKKALANGRVSRTPVMTGEVGAIICAALIMLFVLGCAVLVLLVVIAKRKPTPQPPTPAPRPPERMLIIDPEPGGRLRRATPLQRGQKDKYQGWKQGRLMVRNRRDRERTICPDCGRDVTVTRSGRLMAHNTPADGAPCVSAAWKERNTR